MVRHASIGPSVGRWILVSRDQPRQCADGPGIRPSTARTTTPSFGHTRKVITENCPHRLSRGQSKERPICFPLLFLPGLRFLGPGKGCYLHRGLETTCLILCDGVVLAPRAMRSRG